MSRIQIIIVTQILFLFVSIARAEVRSSENIAELLTHIEQTWNVLTRFPNDCASIVNARVPENSYLYLPANYPEPASVKELQSHCKVTVLSLPERISLLGGLDVHKLKQQGVLYLPNAYIIPGGFFNEMYGWDSYFIIRGLLLGEHLKLARGMVENFFFEIEHYGGILNANRTYFLTRSQPPFLSSMVMAIYDALSNLDAKQQWLKQSYPFIKRDYEMWTSGKKLAGDTGLSRYFDFQEGPVAEITDMHDSYYRDVFHYLETSPHRKEYLGEQGHSFEKLLGPLFTVEICQQDNINKKLSCEKSPAYQFTEDYYKGDRAMRESGFDISFRFGDFSGKTHHFAPVCLNSLLYKTEADMAVISNLLGRTEEAKQWTKRAQHRQTLMNRYLWNAQKGMYFDYDFMKKEQSTYPYATTFYPLWAGVSSFEQAKAVMSHLKNFEHKGGIAMSPYETGVQWDFPYGWAPIQLLTVEGMRHYGFVNDADRIAYKWVNIVAKNFRHEHKTREKYNVVRGSSEANITAGYRENLIDFGWTNGVVLEFIRELAMASPKKHDK